MEWPKSKHVPHEIIAREVHVKQAIPFRLGGGKIAGPKEPIPDRQLGREVDATFGEVDRVMPPMHLRPVDDVLELPCVDIRAEERDREEFHGLVDEDFKRM